MSVSSCFVTIQRMDGTRTTLSGPVSLADAANEAFRLAEELSLPGARSDVCEIAIFQNGALQISIAIEPGVPLTGRK